MIEIVYNGQPRSVPGDISVAALLHELGLTEKPVAVEVNRQLVPRAEHSCCLLRDRDQVEVVTLVGGG